MLELIILIVAFVLLILVIVWLPVLRQSHKVEIVDNTQRDDTNIHLYHEHKREIEKDFAQSNIDDENYQYLLSELDKSLLQDIEANKIASAKENIVDKPISMLWPATLSLFIIIFSFAIYSKSGAYQQLSQPLQTAQAAISAEQQAMQQTKSLLLLTAQEPDNSEAWYSLGQSYISMGEYQQALNAYDQVIRIEGNTADLFGAKAQANYYKNNQKIDAVVQELIDKALAIDPADPSTNILIGMHSFIIENYEKAIKHWQLVVDTGRNNVNSQALIEAITEAKQRQSGVVSSQAPTVDDTQGPQLEVNIQLSAELQAKLALGDDKVVFVYAIAADPEKGRMPLAAVKMNISDLPTSIVLNDSRAMTPQAKLSDVTNVHVYAIVSASGGAGIKPGDYKAELLDVDVKSLEPLSLLINDIVK
ncbi:MAG: cytochrome c-type biogenesis protein CcmH [Alteromonadaceae bacterium]|jgi:cytochrome c-type biogenesis protein CcmH